jgi:branched-chain amino acid transport system substrate-binding protein
MPESLSKIKWRQAGAPHHISQKEKKMNSKIFLKRFLLSSVMIIVLLLGACVPAAPPAPTEAPPAATEAPPVATEAPVVTEAPVETEVVVEQQILKVGFLGPLTGPAARTGEEQKDGAEMALESIGYTIGNYKIELVYIDSQSDPDKATRAYEDAIVRDGIQVGLLGWHSSVAAAVMEVTAKYKIPHFFSCGETGVVNEKFNLDREKYGYWMAKGWPQPKSLVSVNYAVGFKDMIDQGIWSPKNKKVALLGEETDFGRAVIEPLADMLAADGWEVVAEDFVPLEEVDFIPLLSKYKQQDPALTLITHTAAAGISSFVKQAREVGLPGLVVAHGLGWVGEWYTLVGPASDGILDQIPELASDKAKAWATDFEAKYGIKPSPSAGGLAYDWTNMFIKLAEATLAEYGELNSDTFYKFGREKLWTGEFTYTDGIIMPMYKFTPETIPDMVVGKEGFIFPIIQYFGGEGKIIWPLDWAEAKLVVQ